MAKQNKSSAARLSTGDPVLGKNIEAVRKVHKLTQEQLADACGVSKGLISQFEKGITMPSVPVLAKISLKLGTKVDTMLYGSAGTARAMQALLPGMGLEERVAALPEVMREFVLLTLAKAETAARHVPSQFLRAPTKESWPEFAAYLEAISIVGPKE